MRHGRNFTFHFENCASHIQCALEALKWQPPPPLPRHSLARPAHLQTWSRLSQICTNHAEGCTKLPANIPVVPSATCYRQSPATGTPGIDGLPSLRPPDIVCCNPAEHCPLLRQNDRNRLVQQRQGAAINGLLNLEEPRLGIHLANEPNCSTHDTQNLCAQPY